MKLSKLIISNFQSFGGQPVTIDFEDDMSILIGLNGSGKTASLQALTRLFGITDSLRKIKSSDFHCGCAPDDKKSESLFIEAWFYFPEAEKESSDKKLFSVVGTFNQLCFTAKTKELMLRVRLEASLTVDDMSPDGVVDEAIYYVLTDEEDIPEGYKKTLRRTDRNNIQVHYIPASRNPLKEISSSTRVLLGRLLNAVNWDRTPDGELSEALKLTQAASDSLSKNKAINIIESQLKLSWGGVYSGARFSSTKLSFLPFLMDELLKTVSLSFQSLSGNQHFSIDRLSDGQRSLLHIAIIQAVHSLESQVLRDAENAEHFDPSKLNQPVYTMLALEEPENHLAPHFLGRIIKSMKSLSEQNDAQVVITTHSPSLVGRVEPHQIRYFSLSTDNKFTNVSKIPLPDKNDDVYKYVSGAVKAYPEIYFARLVVLGEGESEQIIIPKILNCIGLEVDDSFITVAPLGGRHVNHFWKLLNGLNIPHVTLLDLDYGRNGGGWGRIRYAFEQLKEHCPTRIITEENVSVCKAWDDANTDPMEYTYGDGTRIIDFLESVNVYFSTPLDIDYSMQLAFPEFYNKRFENEYGPQEKIWGDLKKAVLKKGFSEKLGNNYLESEHSEGFLWYNYRFLGSKGKPTAHITTLESIDFSDKTNIDKIPKSLVSMVNKISTLVANLPE